MDHTITNVLIEQLWWYQHILWEKAIFYLLILISSWCFWPLAGQSSQSSWTHSKCKHFSTKQLPLLAGRFLSELLDTWFLTSAAMTGQKKSVWYLANFFFFHSPSSLLLRYHEGSDLCKLSIFLSPKVFFVLKLAEIGVPFSLKFSTHLL